MKKTILLALLALALPASAGSIDWVLSTGGANNYMVGTDGNKLNGTAYLVLTSEYEAATIATLDDITGLALGGDSLAITDGVNKDLVTTTDARITPVDGTTSISFTVLLYDSKSESFYASAAREQKAYNLTGDEFTDQRQAPFNQVELYATAKTRGTQTWSPAPAAVPEPSSAALALAGLALLLKRRRA